MAIAATKGVEYGGARWEAGLVPLSVFFLKFGLIFFSIATVFSNFLPSDFALVVWDIYRYS